MKSETNIGYKDKVYEQLAMCI